jgi:hypothetical protein
MTNPESAAPEKPSTRSSEPLTTLRGNGVDIDIHRVGQVIVGLCVVTLAVLVIVFSIAGAHNNDQVNRLRHDGVPVTIVVSGCIGLLGGSGSNDAGYSCKGTFTMNGRSHTESIPGITFHAPGSSVQAVVVPGDPALLSPVAILKNEHASARVFILPIILFVGLVLLVGAIVLRRRHRHATAPAATDTAREPQPTTLA